MFLKRLTVKGFKSFADKTTLTFEPGVNVVVGPNGSGKSNLVDAVAWVLGAQGARALRGGKMDAVIQDLLSDSGVGRTQHVIVGQGQLDAILNARPEDRRAIIEEAAGILKFRRRKEKAERRLEATEANLLRLGDLHREVRRQLRPLERQAEAARLHHGPLPGLRA